MSTIIIENYSPYFIREHPEFDRLLDEVEKSGQLIVTRRDQFYRGLEQELIDWNDMADMTPQQLNTIIYETQENIRVLERYLDQAKRQRKHSIQKTDALMGIKNEFGLIPR